MLITNEPTMLCVGFIFICSINNSYKMGELIIMKHQQVRDFFKEDYPKLSLLVTACIPSTKALTQSVSIESNSDSRFIYYQRIFNFTNITINKLENTHQHPYKTIITEHYINHVSIKDIMQEIGYSKDATNKKHNGALSSFAKIFRQEQIKNKVYLLLEFE